MRTGLFGGTFDPVHLGHTGCAEEIMRDFALDRVVFIPSKDPVHKNSAFTSALHRCRMLELAISGIRGFELSRIEIDRETPSFSVTTVSAFKDAHPGDELFFITGVDSFNTLMSWRQPETLMQLTSFIVMRRGGETCDPEIVGKTGARIADNRAFDVSSTQIRNILHDGGDAAAYLHPVVVDYIREKRLYSR